MEVYIIFWCFLIGAQVAESDIIIQRTSGLDRDRFTVTDDCTSETCSKTYGAESLVPNLCQCRCPASASTFSVQNRTCVQTMHDCNELLLTEPNSEKGIFTVLVSRSLDIFPKLSIKLKLTGAPLTEAIQCHEPYIKAIEHETSDGFSSLKLSSLKLMTDLTNSTYLQLEAGGSPSNISTELSGLLLKITIGCDSYNNSKCLPLKVHGFQKVTMANSITAAGAHSSTAKPMQVLVRAFPYIVTGSVLGVIFLATLITIIIVRCKESPKAFFEKEGLQVKRVMRNPSMNSTRKHPIARISRSYSISDFRGTRPTSTNNQKHLVGRTSSLRSNTTVDSGKGRSRSNSSFTADPKTLAEAVLSYQSTAQVRPIKDQRPQPKLFKSHEEQLSTVRQGIINVPERTHKTKPTSPQKRFSRFKRLFSRHGREKSQESGSQFSIDFDQFSVHPASQKRFSEGHINPDVSFNTEGRLAQAEEIHVDLTFPEEIHSQEENHSSERNQPSDGNQPSEKNHSSEKNQSPEENPSSDGNQSSEENQPSEEHQPVVEFNENELHDTTDFTNHRDTHLPVTSIDEICDEQLHEYETYEQVNQSLHTLDDFVAM